MYDFELKPASRRGGCLSKPVVWALLIVLIPFFGPVILGMIAAFITP